MRYCLLLLLVFSLPAYPQSKDHIGVTRARMMSLFQKPDLGFVFGTETRIKDGRLRIRAECGACPEYYLTVELIGERQGYVKQASIIFAMDSSINSDCQSKGSKALNDMLSEIFPKWENDIPSLEYWLFHAIAADENTSVHRDGLTVYLVVQKPGSGRIYSLVVDAE